jgi:hypothetical protein
MGIALFLLYISVGVYSLPTINTRLWMVYMHLFFALFIFCYGGSTVDSRLSARGLTALRLNRGNIFLKKKFYFP